MRALVVTNMYPSPRHPALGSFVADQVAALRRAGEAEIELAAFAPGGYRSYTRAARTLRERHRHDRFDVVHAHFGLTAGPARVVPATAHAVTLHGTDLAHPRSRRLTLAGLAVTDLIGVVSEPLAELLPRWARSRVEILPCGVDLHRFGRRDRRVARRELGLPEDEPCLLFPADPARAEKRHDRARAAAGETRLLTLSDVEPARVPLFLNAANAVLVPSEREGFGLAVLEALACDVPVLATPVGIAPAALAGLPGTLCAPFESERWAAALAPHLHAADPRIDGRTRAEPYSSDRMARRLLDAWRRLVV
ncbi:MAG: glycosyltransferase [Solirubrobacterales bacterium]|nr:glycosyltransferase [Solirubrobacterales bacterium]